MIFVNPENATATVGPGGVGLWGFAHNGGSGIIPAHTIIVQNVGTAPATLGLAGGQPGYILAPGKDFRLNVPVGDELAAWDPTDSGNVHLHVMAIVG